MSTIDSTLDDRIIYKLKKRNEKLNLKIANLESEKAELIEFIRFRMKTIDYKESDIFDKFLKKYEA